MSRELSPERAAFLAADFVRGFPAWVGYTVERAAWGVFETRLAVEERHRQQDGFVHAGVMATMADHSMGYAAYTTIPEDMRILTVEYKVNFLRPAAGQTLNCLARVVKPGRTLAITEAEVFALGPAGPVLAAKAMATMAVVPAARLTGS